MINVRHILWIFVLTFVVALFGSGNEALGRDICVIGQKTLPRLSGTVSFVNKESVTNRASVRVTPKEDTQREIFETTTDAEGRFEVSDIADGKYMLIVSRENAVTLFIPVRLRSSARPAKLLITLGATVDEVCGGGEVLLVRKER